MSVLPRSFFERDTVDVARDLLGSLLCHRVPSVLREADECLLVGRIVETEAYLGGADLASHSARGVTRRNYLMFEAPGHAYVYQSYGCHWCFNAVAFAHPPGAVLIRAIEPLDGVREMARRRGLDNMIQLTNGPGKLTRALGIERQHNGGVLFDPASALHIAEAPRRDARIVVTSRIGITRSADLPLRFYLDGNAYVSRRARTMELART